MSATAQGPPQTGQQVVGGRRGRSQMAISSEGGREEERPVNEEAGPAHPLAWDYYSETSL